MHYLHSKFSATARGKSIRYNLINCQKEHTGTAAMRVGFSTEQSPLLPFLIFVDCRGKRLKINKNKIKKLRKWNRANSI